jgi:transcription antitermination factor NusG
MAQAWHVLITQPNRENMAARELTRRGYDWLDPREQVPKLRRGALIYVLRRYIPGYLFVAFDALDLDWAAINHLDGVRRVMCNPPGWPVPLAPAVVKAMHQTVMHPAAPAIIEGTEVRLVNGPFAGHCGTVRRVLKGQFMISSKGHKLYAPTSSVVIA